MKTNQINYFKDGKLYQYDQHMTVYTISNVSFNDEFCLDKKGMETFLKFKNPEIKFKDGILKLKSDKTRGQIKTTSDYLVIPNLDFKTEFKVNADKLKKAVKFVSQNPNEVILQGVSIIEGYIQSTDKYYVYRSKIEGGMEITLDPTFVKELSGEKGVITVKCDDNHVAYEKDGTIIIGRLIAGKYPDVSKLYSFEGAKTEIPKDELKSFLDLGTNDDAVLFEANAIKILGDNAFEMQIEIPFDKTICCSLKRLKTIIDTINNDVITIGYTDEKHPLKINDEYLLLPMRRG